MISFAILNKNLSGNETESDILKRYVYFVSVVFLFALFIVCSVYLGSILELLGPLGPIWGASWGLLGHLGASWGHLGSILGPLGSILGSSWRILGPSWSILGPLGPILRTSWGILGPSWEHLGPILEHLGESWSFRSPSWQPLGASWGFRGGFLEASWERAWPLGAS